MHLNHMVFNVFALAAGGTTIGVAADEALRFPKVLRMASWWFWLAVLLVLFAGVIPYLLAVIEGAWW